MDSFQGLASCRVHPHVCVVPYYRPPLAKSYYGQGGVHYNDGIESSKGNSNGLCVYFYQLEYSYFTTHSLAW